MNEDLIRARLQLEVEGYRTHFGDNHPGIWITQQAILDAGTTYEGRALPSRYRKRQPKLCYWNTIKLVRRCKGRLKYCEGYAMAKDFHFLFAHAWAVEEAGGGLVDTTLANPEKYLYRGVCFTAAEYAAEVAKPFTSLLDTGRGANCRLLSRLSPTVGDALDAFNISFLSKGETQ